MSIVKIDLDALPLPSDDDLKSFWAKVKRTDGCWNWSAAKNHHGYGVYYFRPAKINCFAHRISYVWFRGRVGKNLVCHSCDNPSCIRPEHLFLGTAKDNAIDAYAKGRRKPRGYNNHVSRGAPVRIKDRIVVNFSISLADLEYIESEASRLCADNRSHFFRKMILFWRESGDEEKAKIKASADDDNAYQSTSDRQV